jgi:hypothetical protein
MPLPFRHYCSGVERKRGPNQRGEVRPSGPSLTLLALGDKKGIDAILRTTAAMRAPTVWDTEKWTFSRPN